MKRLAAIVLSLLTISSAVGCSLRKVRWTISLFAHDPKNEVQPHVNISSGNTKKNTLFRWL